MPSDELIEVPIEQIVANPHQPRRIFAASEIEDLARSIQSLGLLHPPVVRRLSLTCYELIAGERRLRALQKVGLTTIPVLLRQADEEISAQAALMENLQRVDLNPIETAEALRSLMQKFHLKQEDVALKIGKKRSTIANYLRLLTLPEKIRSSVALGQITMGHAKVLLSLEDPSKRDQLFHSILDGKLTVRQTEEKTQVYKPRAVSSDLKDLINRLQNHFGTQVAIEEKKEGGRIIIDYYNLDDLDRLLELFLLKDEI